MRRDRRLAADRQRTGMLIVVGEGPGAAASIASVALSPGGAFETIVTGSVAPAFERAARERRDMLLLSPGATIRPGTIAELQAVAVLDPMIAFVEARSVDDGDEAAADRLPRSTYLPVAGAGCTLVRWTMPAEFGPLDADFRTAAGAVADLAMRANRRGYRSVRANRAAVDGPVVGIEGADRARLDERHPALARAERRHAADPARRVERMIGALAAAPAKQRILFDCRMMHAYFSGTCEHARQLLVAFVARHGARFECRVLVSEAGYRFHRLDAIAGLVHQPPDAADQPPVAIAFRLAQPFDLDALVSLVRRAPLAGALMLDTIALDCQHLDEAGLDGVWAALTDCAAVLGFNSRFSQRQFAARFAIPATTTTFVSLCSTATDDYATPTAPGAGILLVGNHYPHKALAEMVAALTAVGAAGRTTVLGVETEGVATSLHAGSLPQATVDALYDGAGVLLFPSHYEGFGLPVMQALARRKPVVARDLPCLRELAAHSPFGHNLHFAETTTDLAGLAAAAPAWDATPRTVPQVQDWGLAADALADAFDAALARFDYDDCVRRQRNADLLAARLDAAAALADAASGLAARDVAVAHAVAERDAAQAESRVNSIRATAAEWDAHVDALAVTAMRAARAVALADEVPTTSRWPFGSAVRRSVHVLTMADAVVLRGWGDGSEAAAARIETLLVGLLDWISLQAVGTPVRVVVPDDAGDLAGPAGRLLEAVGCRTDRIRGRRGCTIADGTLVLPVPVAPDAEMDDVMFVQLCARLTLGRPADAVELGEMMRALACGDTRSSVWRRMTARGARFGIRI